MILFADWACPFAHRVRALLEHLGSPPDLRETALGAAPRGLTHYTASARLPVLVHADLVITESRVMLEHLAEHHALATAYPADLTARTRDRHAMAIVDDFFAPMLFSRTDADLDGPRLEDAVRALADATATSAPQPRLLAFHAAPIWLCLRLWHPQHAVTRAIEARPALCKWLDAALQLDCLAQTAPDPEAHAHALSRARQLGLLPAT